MVFDKRMQNMFCNASITRNACHVLFEKVSEKYSEKWWSVFIAQNKTDTVQRDERTNIRCYRPCGSRVGARARVWAVVLG